MTDVDNVPGDYLIWPVGGEPTMLRQTVPAHRPGDGAIGDCYRTAIACLLGEDEPTAVPHFVEEGMAVLGRGSGWDDFRRARVWLREQRGLDLACIEQAMADDLGVAYIATVRSQTGDWPHSVIARHGKVIHDPSGRDYTAAAIDEHGVDLLVKPYEPDPDELLRRWQECADGDAVLLPTSPDGET